MKQFEKITINAKLEAKAVLLIIMWLFLIALPYLILSEIIEVLLKDSEKSLLSKSKIQLVDEINDFRANLTSSYYLDSKLSVFPNNTKVNDINVNFLKESLERHTKSRVAALFYYNISENIFESYIDEDFRKDLGMHSRHTLKNLLLSYASENCDEVIRKRSVAYFENLLQAAGGINLKPEISAHILSGKSNLGRMLGYFKAFKIDNKNQAFLCLFREKDIPLREIIKNSIYNESNNNFKREIISFNEINYIASTSDKIGDERFVRYQMNEKDGLSAYSTTSDEMLLRLGTVGTYYPFRIKEIKEKEPILKVTIPNSYLKHPMRATISNLRFPAFLLILLTTFGLVKIGIFGYGLNIRILVRVIICVTGAVLLPFASFAAALYYNQYFTEEYNENEIEHYTHMQLEVMNKALEAYLGNKELEITKLQDRITGLTSEEIYEALKDWIKDSNASIISYNYITDEEILVKPEESDEKFSILANEAKKYFNICFSNAFKEVDLSKIESESDIESKFGKFLPNQIAPLVTNIGRIYTSVPNEPNSLYSLFPIFKKEKLEKGEKTELVGSVFIKFDTYKLLNEFKKRMPGLFRDMVIGKYLVRNAIIPITEDNTIPFIDKMFLSGNFPIDKITKKLNQLIKNKSQMVWNTNDSINSGVYINIVNAIAVSVAENNRVKVNSEFNFVNIFLYIIFMIISLSATLANIIVSPIKELQKASEKIVEGNYNYKINAKTGDEFEILSEAFNEMTEALLQKEKMSNYVSKDVIEDVSNNNEQLLQPSGERIPVSVLFCALSGENELSTYTSEDVIKIISCLIDAADEISTAFNGQVDKLIEDTVMIVFRKTHPNENISINACRAALAINARLKNELPGFKIKMGIASGDAVYGKIGSRNGKLDYTVIGNPVNLAARLKVQADKAKNTGILICPNSIRLIQGAGRLKFIERMTIKGRTNRTFPLYELIGLRDF